MLKKRLSFVFGLLIIASMVLAACGPAETPAPAEPVAPAEPAAPAEEPAAPAEEPEPEPEPEPTAVPRTTRKGGWLDQITMVAVSADAVITQLEAGEIDLFAGSLGRPEDLRAAQAAGLQTQTVFGGYYELTFNPVGPVFEDSTGKLNPFAVPAVREAMNMLIDRDFIVQEIYGGLAVPKFFAINSAFPDYALLADVARELEAQYAFNVDKAKEVIDAEMLALGAELVDGKWNYNGEPVVINILIRNDGDLTRIGIGDYVADQLENIGFETFRDYKSASEASPIWISGNPADGLFHIYTGGWITTAVARDQGDNFNFFYTPDGLGFPLWQAYQNTEEFYELTVRLSNADYTTLEERREVFAEALRLSMEDSIRVWVVDQTSFTPLNQGIEVASDLAGGLQGGQLQGFTLRFSGQEGGDLTYALADVLTEPWNPVGGSNWVFDTAPKRIISDYGVFSDPFTGLAWPSRIATAQVTVQTGLPVGATLDWVELEFADEIVVPDDAFVDWDAENQVFITSAEKFPDGQTALRKSVVTYPDDHFDTVMWHDGTKFSPADFLMFEIIRFDRAKEASAIYDEAAVSPLASYLTAAKGFRITSTSPFTVEYYSDFWQLDAELNVATMWPEYGFGNASWYMIAIGELAEKNGELAFSSAKADANEVEWMSYVAGPSLEILGKYLDQAIEEQYIPYEATLGQYLTADEAVAAYSNYKAWFDAQGHYWVATGPYYLDKVFSVEKTLTLKTFPDYVDLADKWAGFAQPKVSEVDVDGEGRVTIGGEAIFDVFVSFQGEAYPLDELDNVKYLLFDATGTLVEVGQAEAVADGVFEVVLSGDTTSKLAEGSNKLEVVVVSKLVSIPTFAAFEFVTAK
jgi:peptide/nickel transport system substrate-binding protein